MKKAMILFCTVALAVNAHAQAVEPAAGNSAEQHEDDASRQAESVSNGETQYLEAFPEEAPEQSYTIYRKDNPDNPCDRGLDEYDYETTWYDESQIFINSKFCEPALWFDNFFADDRIFDEGAAGTYVRWRNEFTYDEDDKYSYDMNLNFSIELPGIENKLRLTFTNDENEDLQDIAPGAGTSTNNSLGLQLDIKETSRSKFNADISLTPRVRFRYRYTYPYNEKVILRFIQEIQREKAVNSTRTQFDYENNFRKNFVFRSSTEAKLSEIAEGLGWLQAFVVYQRLNKKTSLSYESSVNGVTEPWTTATNYRLGVRYRKNFHREWLFYEIAPAYNWPVTIDKRGDMLAKERRSLWQIFFRLEVHFGNARQKGYQSYL